MFIEPKIRFTGMMRNNLKPYIERAACFYFEFLDGGEFAAFGIFRAKDNFIVARLDGHRISCLIGIQVIDPLLCAVIKNLIETTNSFRHGYKIDHSRLLEYDGSALTLINDDIFQQCSGERITFNIVGTDK